MVNEVDTLINEIQFKTGMTLDEIAAKIGYTRPYLNIAKLKGGSAKLIGVIKEKFADTLNGSKNDNNKYLQLLESNDRFFKHIIGTNLVKADSVQGLILAHLRAIIQENADQKSTGDKKKYEKELQAWDKRIASNLEVSEQKDIMSNKDNHNKMAS